jgi:hypothetical protein
MGFSLPASFRVLRHHLASPFTFAYKKMVATEKVSCDIATTSVLQRFIMTGNHSEMTMNCIIARKDQQDTRQKEENMFIKTIGNISIAASVALPMLAVATDYQIVERPRQECWNEQVPVQSSSHGYGGAIVGGLAGGILGNQVGGGNGKTVATAVGAATGAVVGDRMSAPSGSHGTSYQTVQRCRTVVEQVRVPVAHERGHFCPPGQAKKGNC